MRILYLPEWGEKIEDAKIKILNKFGDDVWCPKIDYIGERNIIYSYAREIQQNGNPTLIIGSSLGGYMAYHMANIVKFPSLLFNPTFYFKNGGEVKRDDGMDEYLEKTIVFSTKSEDIDIKRTVKFLEEYNYKNIKFYDGLTHIPLDIFENEFIEFREKHKNIKGTRNENVKKSSLDYAAKVGVKKNRFVPDEELAERYIPDDAVEPEPVPEPVEPIQWNENEMPTRIWSGPVAVPGQGKARVGRG